MQNIQTVLACEGVTRYYGKGKARFAAVQDLNITLKPGESLGLVGASGSGKSTLARLVTRLEPVDSGAVYLEGRDITHLKGKNLRECYRRMQMVFQDPVQSFNPRMRIGHIMIESIRNLSSVSLSESQKQVYAQLQLVGLGADYAGRYPHQLSGGECQRAAVARALSVHPGLLVCDEATSALDVSVQAQLLTHLKRLQNDTGFACLFISHDLAVVSGFCERMAVMHHGRIIETGSTQDILRNPKQEATKRLISSACFL